MNPKPNLIGIGGQKCASTWLSECLRSHPEVFMSSPKELRFFVDNESKGVDWYFGFFESAADFTYRAEFSSNYIYWPESAEKIKSTLGDVKVIAVVREPADRSLSHIKHLIRDGDLLPKKGEITKKHLEEIVDQHPKVLSNSYYQPGLQKYRDVFGKDAVFVVCQKTCRDSGKFVLDALWNFLEIGSAFEITEVDKVVSAGINPKFSQLEAFRKYLFSAAKYRAPWFINWIKKSGLSSLYRNLNSGEKIFFSHEAEEYIQSLCAEDWYSTQAILSIK